MPVSETPLADAVALPTVESTLREGEQFANAFFDTETKIKIAKALDDFGVDYIELTSPAASEQSRRDCETICKLGLKAKILTHVRCHMDDARLAVETGVDGLDVVIGTSSYLREHSHGKDMTYIINVSHASPGSTEEFPKHAADIGHHIDKQTDCDRGH